MTLLSVLRVFLLLLLLLLVLLLVTVMVSLLAARNQPHFHTRDNIYEVLG